MRFLGTLIAAMLTLAPLALAHIPPGPKNYCESWSDWSVHEYWSEGYNSVPGDPSQTWAYAGYAGFGAMRAGLLHGPWDGSVLGGDCNGDLVPGDYDGHKEFAVGGAVLAAENGGNYGPFSAWPNANWGAYVCLGEEADHPRQTTITVVDAVNGGALGFDIAADHARDAVPADPGADNTLGTWDDVICGDHVIEPCNPTDVAPMDQVTCNASDRVLPVSPKPMGSASNSGTPNFDPGQNGAYLVFLQNLPDTKHPGGPTLGHVF